MVWICPHLNYRVQCVDFEMYIEGGLFMDTRFRIWVTVISVIVFMVANFVIRQNVYAPLPKRVEFRVAIPASSEASIKRALSSKETAPDTLFLWLHARRTTEAFDGDTSFVEILGRFRFPSSSHWDLILYGEREGLAPLYTIIPIKPQYEEVPTSFYRLDKDKLDIVDGHILGELVLFDYAPWMFTLASAFFGLGIAAVFTLLCALGYLIWMLVY